MAGNLAIEMENTAPPSTPTTASTGPSSDAAAFQRSSPASSPPAFPWDEREMIEKKYSYPAPERNIFSVLGKRKLTPLNRNAVTVAAKKTKRSDDGKTQMQLHLGQKTQRRCKECGMQYVSSSNEDRQLHVKFHKQHTEGVEVGATFVETAPSAMGRRIYDGVVERESDKIVMVDCFDKKPRRRKGQEVLEIVQRDLGAVEIAEADVWEGPREEISDPKFRSFMYIREGKCVAFLLVERICQAFEVLPPSLPPDEDARRAPLPDEPSSTDKTSALAALQARKRVAESERAHKESLLQAAAKQPLVLARTRSLASLGVCRIWTLPSHRGQGLAIALLDAAVQWRIDHVQALKQRLPKSEGNQTSEAAEGSVFARDLNFSERRTSALRDIVKKDVAFSQPTAAGTKLARKWMGKMSGWKVYLD